MHINVIFILFFQVRRLKHVLQAFRTRRTLEVWSIGKISPKGSERGWKSPYISACGSLNSVLTFRSKSRNSTGQSVQISEDNLPVFKNDLRKWSNGKNHYIHDIDSNESINRFNNFTRKYDEVLLIGYVPNTHVQHMSESDLYCEQLSAEVATCYNEEESQQLSN